jgi:hypothetical protein
MLDVNAIQEGTKVRYRPSPVAQGTLGGTFIRSARAKEPAAMILFEGEETPRIAYCARLELAD